MFVIRHRSADWYNQYGGNNERFAEPSAVPGTGITAAGQRNLNNSFVVDGLSANDAADLAGAFFSPDVIREFLAVTSGGIAEFGRASSGIVNILTQSDSNLCRGSAYGYLRNQRFDGTNISLKEEVCEDSCLIEIRRCKMAPSDVVRSWHGAPEVDITPELGRWEPPHN